MNFKNALGSPLAHLIKVRIHRTQSLQTVCQIIGVRKVEKRRIECLIDHRKIRLILDFLFSGKNDAKISKKYSKRKKVNISL